MTVPSDRNAHRMKKFISGLTLGAFTALAGGTAAVYVLNMTQVVAVSIVSVPDIHQTLAWAYDNLRLSVIPFFLVLMIFCRDLVILRRQLAQSTISLTAICQRESLIDMWIKIFFGIGVIWTAIGLRNALLEGVGAWMRPLPPPRVLSLFYDAWWTGGYCWHCLQPLSAVSADMPCT
jgi:hypothetical protein